MDWSTNAQSAFEEIENAHRAVGGSGPGRRTLTQQLNYSYVSLLAARFQGFSRALHSEAAAQIAALAGNETIVLLMQTLLTLNRDLDHGNATPDRLAKDFNRFGFDFWAEVEARDSRNAGRKERLANLIRWRNAIQHHDVEAKLAAGKLTPKRITLKECRRWRSALTSLAASVDGVVADQCQALGTPRLW